MCNISVETIIRASKRTAGVDSAVRGANVSPDGIVISARYNGKEYSQSISFKQIRENYGKALKEYSRYGKEL